MPIASSDIKLYKSTSGTSLGGAITGVELTGSIDELFDAVSGAEAASGDVEFRCLYVKNGHSSLTATAMVVWILSQTTSADTDLEIGLGTSAINGTEQTVGTESDAPAGVTFSAPSVEGSALSIGNVPAGQHKAIWLKRNVNAGAAAIADDASTLRFKFETAA